MKLYSDKVSYIVPNFTDNLPTKKTKMPWKKQEVPDLTVRCSKLHQLYINYLGIIFGGAV